MPCYYFDVADRGELLCDEDGTEVLKFLPPLAKEQPQDGDERACAHSARRGSPANPSRQATAGRGACLPQPLRPLQYILHCTDERPEPPRLIDGRI